MLKMEICVLVVAVVFTFFALAKAAGMADRRLEEIQRFTADRQVGGLNGN